MQADVEQLARMAARLAGCEADWRDPDFVRRAETAYSILRGQLSPEALKFIHPRAIGRS